MKRVALLFTVIALCCMTAFAQAQISGRVRPSIEALQVTFVEDNLDAFAACHYDLSATIVLEYTILNDQDVAVDTMTYSERQSADAWMRVGNDGRVNGYMQLDVNRPYFVLAPGYRARLDRVIFNDIVLTNQTAGTWASYRSISISGAK